MGIKLWYSEVVNRIEKWLQSNNIVYDRISNYDFLNIEDDYGNWLVGAWNFLIFRNQLRIKLIDTFPEMFTDIGLDPFVRVYIEPYIED